MNESKNISAIILAGGKSSRMGTDKGLVDFNGKKMIEHVIAGISTVAGNIMVVSNNNCYREMGYNVVRDMHLNCGPLGGIHAGLAHSVTEWNFVVGCDMPFVNHEIIDFLVGQIGDADAIVPVHDNKFEPLCALYHLSAIAKIETLLLSGELKMQNVIRKLNTVFIAIPKEKFDAAVIFRNINAPADLISATLQL